VGKITAWSYSRWSDYEKCPLLAKFKHVDRIKEPENEAMKGGLKAHDSLADFLAGKIELPEVGNRFATLLMQLRELEPLHDQEWGFTNQWRPTGWFDKNCWFRSKLDSAVVYDDHTADVVDFKTGKESPTHAGQAELYAISILVRYREVSHVIARFWYLDTGAESVFRYSRNDLDELIKKWEDRVQPMLNDTIFAPRPGKHCKYCFYAKSNNGNCKFG
jgi:CRISPR/Cas system-associated exonuclease Cas4 (RecB family)